MILFVLGVWTFLRTLCVDAANVSLENVALRQQLAVLQRSVPRPKVCRRDRLWSGWRSSLPTWRTFLEAHLREIAAVDFFVVPTLTYRLLFGFIILRHDRRELIHISTPGYRRFCLSG